MNKQKKIGIITWHSLPNHGAMLQMYATKELFEKEGVNVKVILHNYNVEVETKKKPSIVKHLLWYCKIDNWRAKKNWKESREFDKAKRMLFDNFQNMNYQVQDDFNGLDAVCIGSDEVFSLTNGYNPMFYGVGIKIPVFSFAGSFGQTSLEDICRKELNSILRDSFNRMLKVSVRDENSANIVFTLTNKKPLVHLDPVLIWGFKDRIVFNDASRFNRILLYSYNQNMNLGQEIKMIREISKIENMSVESIGFFHYWCDKNVNCDPFEVLEEFSKSKFIITDTFHGLVMAVITHSNFAVVIRNNFNSNKLTSLIEMLELEERVVTAERTLADIYSKPIDYDKIEGILKHYRYDALQYLKQCILEISNV